MAATIKDVALHAGVSTTTVSHVLNETRFVAETTRERVFKASRELNYAPSAVARSLKVKTTKSLGMLVTTTLNPFYAEVVREVEKYCYQQGYNLILCNTDGDSIKTSSYLQMLAQKRVDGILIMCTAYDDAQFETISAQRNLPMVVMDWGPTDAYLDRIQDNSFKGGLLATQYLIEAGHRDIAYIGGPKEKLPAQQRIKGFRQAMADAGISINPDWVLESDFECEGGRRAMTALLTRDKLPTAIFAGNDMMAMGVMSVAQQQGLLVPEQLSIVGYDNISFSAYFSPPLTTVNQPKEPLAKLAVSTLIDRLNEPRSEGKVMMLEPDLVIRNSVAAPAG